jgi:hypothetical protein
MTNTFDSDDVDLPYNERAVHALLGCLCAGPRDATGGDWVLLLEGPHAEPLALSHIALVFDSEAAPLAAATEALSRAGYEHRQAVVTTPWAAGWQIIRPEDREITRQQGPP